MLVPLQVGVLLQENVQLRNGLIKVVRGLELVNQIKQLLDYPRTGRIGDLRNSVLLLAGLDDLDPVVEVVVTSAMLLNNLVVLPDVSFVVGHHLIDHALDDSDAHVFVVSF